MVSLITRKSRRKFHALECLQHLCDIPTNNHTNSQLEKYVVQTGRIMKPRVSPSDLPLDYIFQRLFHHGQTFT